MYHCSSQGLHGGAGRPVRGDPQAGKGADSRRPASSEVFSDSLVARPAEAA